MDGRSISGVVVAHAFELEGAFRHVNNELDPLLLRAAAGQVALECETLGWAYEAPEDFRPSVWFAPEEWRTAGDEEDEFDLFADLEGTDCVDGSEPETWVAQFLGFGGSGLCLSLGSNLLTAKPWKALLRSETDAIDRLVSAGFRCDARMGMLTLPIVIERSALIEAFDDGELEAALKPIRDAMNRLGSMRSDLDELVELIRSRANGANA